VVRRGKGSTKSEEIGQATSRVEENQEGRQKTTTEREIAEILGEEKGNRPDMLEKSQKRRMLEKKDKDV